MHVFILEPNITTKTIFPIVQYAVGSIMCSYSTFEPTPTTLPEAKAGKKTKERNHYFMQPTRV